MGAGVRHNPYVVIRTRFFDDWLPRVIRDADAPRQVVLLGAGMDTRAWLRRTGWQPEAVVQPGDDGAHFGRWIAPPAVPGAAPASPSFWFATGRRAGAG